MAALSPGRLPRRFLPFLALLLALPAAAAPELHDRRWLPAGAVLAPPQLPAERLTVAAGADPLVELGRLAFRSPEILGGNARLAGIACQTCHPNGGANAAFCIPGLSDRPGRVDVAHRLWHPAGEDGRDLPLDIPPLHGAADAAPYGTVAPLPGLRDFTRRVAVAEFGGAEPAPRLLDALVAYQQALAAPDAPAASELARGEAPADLPRYLAVLDGLVAEGDAALAELASRMIRAALGRMAAAAEREQPWRDWAIALAGIGRAAEAGDIDAARRRLDGLAAEVAAALRP